MISSPVHSLLDSSEQGLGGNPGSKASPGASKLSAPIGYDPGRTLAHVLREITNARQAFNASWHTVAESGCLDHLERLSDEARAMIEAATGVRWEDIEGASL